MSGLVISLRAEEKFLVNGALLKNGPKRSQIYVEDDNVFVLRLSDALHPDQINTPMKRIYYAVQLILSGDSDIKTSMESVLDGLLNLADIFQGTPLVEPLIRAHRNATNKRFYSVLYTLKSMFEIEETMLNADAKITSVHPTTLQVTPPEMAQVI